MSNFAGDDPNPPTVKERRSGRYAAVMIVVLVVGSLVMGLLLGRAEFGPQGKPKTGWTFISTDLYARTFAVDGRRFTCFSNLRTNATLSCVSEEAQ